MRTWLTRGATAALLATMLSTPAHAQIKALVLGGFGQSGVEAIKADLFTGDGRIDFAGSAAYGYSSLPLPSLSYLSQFDAVLAFTDQNSGVGTDLSNLLANYVDAGGGVVLSTFWGQQVNGGRLNTTGYNPLINRTFDAYSAVSLGTFNAADPLMAGVTSVTANTYAADYQTGLDTGATLAASWDNGRPLAAYNAGKTVATITLYANNPAFGHAGGDYRRLFNNALVMVGGDAGAVPEPASWAMMIGGFGLIGGALRRRAKVSVAFA